MSIYLSISNFGTEGVLEQLSKEVGRIVIYVRDNETHYEERTKFLRVNILMYDKIGELVYNTRFITRVERNSYNEKEIVLNDFNNKFEDIAIDFFNFKLDKYEETSEGK